VHHDFLTFPRKFLPNSLKLDDFEEEKKNSKEVVTGKET
jgi:hypothetical protein